MNISFNPNVSKTAAPEVRPEAAPAKSSAAPSVPDLTITQAPASLEDIAAATIPESALSRDDDLGRLVSSAFNLPAPPMPSFPDA
jgi:hypothetical protein